MSTNSQTQLNQPNQPKSQAISSDPAKQIPQTSEPEHFRFGVAVADHQVEAYDPQTPDIWDDWEARHALQQRGRATDFRNRYREDVKNAAKLGCRLFRFSIAWARVRPEGKATDWSFYRELIALIRASDMEPVVTLLHFTWPRFLQHDDRSGLLDADFPDAFADYAGEAARELGDGVGYWLTFNEPGQLAFGYFKFWTQEHSAFPPGLIDDSVGAQTEAITKLIPNLFRAHQRARQRIRQVLPDARVSANPLINGLPGVMQSYLDWRVQRLNGPADLQRQLSTFADRTANLLEAGSLDAVIATMSVTKQRRQSVAFSTPYAISHQRLMVLEASPTQAIADITGSVAVKRSTTAQSSFSQHLPWTKPILFETDEQSVQALLTQQVNAVLGDQAVLERWISESHNFRFLPEDLSTEEYAVAVTPGHPDLLNLADDAVLEVRFNVQSDALPKRKVQSGTTLDRIRKRGYLVVGVRPGVPGLCEESHGQFVGLEPEIARAMARRLFGQTTNPDQHIKFKPIKTEQRVPRLRAAFPFLVPVVEALDRARKMVQLALTIFNSNWWSLGMAGKLPTFLCPEECVGAQDFAAFDYYWGVGNWGFLRLPRLIKAGEGLFDTAPVWPGGLYQALQLQGQFFPGQEIIIMENGSVPHAHGNRLPTSDSAPSEPATDGISRSQYLELHLAQVERALRSGVRVTGYICWSITTNREWGYKLSAACDFGLYKIDLDNDPTLNRIETLDVTHYAKLIQKFGATFDQLSIQKQKRNGLRRL